MLGLKDKIIFITGGSRGLGKATARLLLDLGARVAYTYRQEPAKDLPAQLSIKADVRDSESMKQAVERVEEELGPIYGVIANAGITQDAFCTKLTTEQWDDVINTNLKGVYNTIRPILAQMYTRKSGSIVFISSIVGERGNIGQVNYAASKAGLIGMAKALALESARYEVRVNAVSPGFIETEMTQNLPDKLRKKILDSIPLKRFAQVEEIAWAVIMLLSPVSASYITGISLSVNGGQRT